MFVAADDALEFARLYLAEGLAFADIDVPRVVRDVV